MAPAESTIRGAPAVGGDVFGAGVRGFFDAFPGLRLVRAVLVTLVALPFVLFLAISVSSVRRPRTV